jgi:hypothetical protein
MDWRSLVESWRDGLARINAPTVLVELQDQRLRLQPLKGGIELDLPLPEGLCQEGLPLEIEALGDFIGDLLVEQGWVKAVVVAALPLQGAEVRVIEDNGSSTANALMDVVRAQEQQLRLPFALADADLDLQPLDPQAGRWLMVAARKRVVEAWLRVFDLAGAELKRLEPVQLTWLAVASAEEQPGLMLVARVEPSGCQVFAALGEQPLYSAVLPGPRQAWSDQLADVVRLLLDEHALDPAAPWRVWSELPTQPILQLAEQVGSMVELVQVPEPYTSMALAGLARLA